MLPPSALQISAKQPSFGTGKLANPSATRLFGKTGELLLFVTKCEKIMMI
jgi:hypothetical protein